MSQEDVKAMVEELLASDSEEEVISILKEYGYWDQPEAWRLYGDRDGNFAVIGNQASRPEAALVEKIVNSVDARLLYECLVRGIDPTSEEAPQSLREAVAVFIEETKLIGEEAGKLRFWSPERQLEQSRFITLAVTGPTARKGGPSLTIADRGEGQTPALMPETFLSIDRENKLRIPFVQGKFNMGGTGALKFCGRDGMQLIITRRSPELTYLWPDDPTAELWGVTVVRRVRPSPGPGAVRNSVYRYLAPVGADEKPNKGSILTFAAPSIKALPHQNRAYAREMEWGSIIKLYEYDMKGFRSHALMPDGLLFRLELLLPGVALPVRVHECRAYRGKKKRSFENTLVGLSARLEANRGGNLEEGFPTSVPFRVAGEDLSAEIYVFKAGKADTYRKNEGIVFTINGQTHGAISKPFFGRRKVKMGRLADSLLVLIDCSRLSVGAREDLFMNSRDRLSNGTLRQTIEAELEDLISKHHGLRELRERRRREEIAERLEDSKPLEDVLGSILKSSPTLNRLFLLGQRLSRPHKAQELDGKGGGTGEDAGSYVGKPHPTYFRFAKKPADATITRTAQLGRRCRIKFETDVVNDYFSRPSVPGHYYMDVLEGGSEGLDLDHSLTLHDGIANWSITIPDDVPLGEELTLQCTVTDDTLIEPFVNIAKIQIQPRREGGNGTGERTGRIDQPGGTRSGAGSKGSKGADAPGGIKLPTIHKVKDGDPQWKRHGFDERTACKVIEDAVPGGDTDESEFTFYVNTSNVYLRTEMKGTRDDPAVAEAKFVFGNVLVGLAVLNEAKNGKDSPERDTDGEDATPEERVHITTRALAPFLLPMIDYLGSLSPDEVSGLGSVGDED